MTGWTGELVGEVLSAPPVRGHTFRAIATDTRTLGPGDLFVALTGPRFDGHAFLGAAREAGATGAVVRRGTPTYDGLALFEVESPLRALGLLARHRRRAVDGPVVAVTGTNGKTSTRELIARALSPRWTVHATRANRNNEIGVPLTILEAPDDADALVIEAGASVPGEIGRLREIIAPGIAVVTNVSAGHVEGFGSLEAILSEKLTLLHGVRTAVVGIEPPHLVERARAIVPTTRSAGLTPPADVLPDCWSLGDDGRAALTVRGHDVRLPLVGRHQAANAMIALAVAQALEVDHAAAVRALETARLPGGRCEVLRAGGLTVLNDAYNANPDSFLAALETAAAMRGARRLAVVAGSMLELGPTAAWEHERVAEAIVAADPVLVGAVGAFVPAFERHRDGLGERLIVGEDGDDIGRRVAERLAGSELVLVKASRGVRLERALPHLLPDREALCSPTS